MKTMTTVKKIMREDVRPLRADEPVERAWRAMREQGVSGLPVTEADGRLIGVVTADDLITRQAPRRLPPWWHVFRYGPARLADDYRKALGVTVGDVMSFRPVAIDARASMEAAAELMHTRHVGLLPVVADGVLVGVLTRAEVIEAGAWPARRDVSVPDAELVSEMESRLERESWVSSHTLRVEASQGVLRLYGLVDSEAERAAITAMARSIPGCADVEDYLLFVSQINAGRR
jgi:CBS domain-containing protein